MVSNLKRWRRFACRNPIRCLRIFWTCCSGSDGARHLWWKWKQYFNGISFAWHYDSTIIETSEAAIQAVPDKYYEGALALGATHERSVYRTVVPAAKSGILAGIILGVGRAIGETMAVIMIAGNQARMPAGLLKGVRTLTANIVIEMGYAADLHREALIATGVVLFVFILIINLLFSLLKRKKVD
jgi:phosphate transport system permease protein